MTYLNKKQIHDQLELGGEILDYEGNLRPKIDLNEVVSSIRKADRDSLREWVQETEFSRMIHVDVLLSYLDTLEE